MEKLKQLGKVMEKYVLRPALQFTKNRFKEKSSAAGLLTALAGVVGLSLPAEQAALLVQVVYSFMDIETAASGSDIATGLIAAGAGLMLTPTKKKAK